MGTNDVYEVFLRMWMRIRHTRSKPFESLLISRTETQNLSKKCHAWSNAAPSFPERLLYGRFMSLFN